jgi:hypothetical protein
VEDICVLAPLEIGGIYLPLFFHESTARLIVKRAIVRTARLEQQTNVNESKHEFPSKQKYYPQSKTSN